jgi:hypothetical protein
MEALGVAATLEHPAGELVDDLHLAVVEQVLDVPVVQLLGAQRRLHVVDQVDGGVVVEVLDPEDLLDPRHALLGDEDLALALVDLVVLVRAGAGRSGRTPCTTWRCRHPTGDDQRRPGLVDEDRVDLVDDGVVVTALDHVGDPHRHVVAQIVEPELVVGAVRDVGLVGGRRSAASCRPGPGRR